MTKCACVCLIVVCLSLAGAPNSVAGQDPQSAPGRYHLRAGDVVDLNFPFVPAFNQTISVQPDGYISPRALGPLRVDGMTVADLTRALREEYVSILRDPVITVELKDFEKPYFIVAGEVERPGKYDLRGETTAMQAVAVAGGLKERARHSRAVVFRRLPAGGFETKPLDLKKLLKERRLNADLRLEPGDTLFIPKGRGSLDFRGIASSLWWLGYLY